MAETLGSLVDKITIKEIRKYHLQEMRKQKNEKFSVAIINSKITLLNKQIGIMSGEIDDFIKSALKGDIHLRDEKLKIYNDLKDMGRIAINNSIGQAILGLAQKNLELWHLEDEARRKNAAMAYVGKIKRKIDLANQQRNDYIDRIDQLFENKIKSPSDK